MQFLLSGDLYMQVDEERKLGRVIEPEDGPNGWMPLESMFAHVHTNEPWEEVELDQVPDEIREVAKLKGPIAPM